MKVRVVKRCFYNNSIVDPKGKDGNVNYLDIPNGKMPTWAVAADVPIVEAEKVESEKESKTIHEMANKSRPNIARPGGSMRRK